MSKQSESVESTGTEILQESQQSTASSDAVSRRSDPWATLTAHERLLLGGDPAFDLRQVAQRAGTGLDLAQRFWQAMGFADVDLDAVRFTERDVEALCGVADLIDEHDDGAPSPSAPGGGARPDVPAPSRAKPRSGHRDGPRDPHPRRTEWAGAAAGLDPLTAAGRGPRRSAGRRRRAGGRAAAFPPGRGCRRARGR